MSLGKGRRLKILCLHGSRQDGEIFSQRLRVLSKRLADVVELHYVDAPHCLPLQPGQDVAMRSWWRHPWLDVQQAEEEQQDGSSVAFSTDFISNASSWLDVVVEDWSVSLKVLEQQWHSCPGGFDGILGFSNGAAAGFLLAAHATAHMARFPSLKFVILAGGYIPQPLDRLLPAGLTEKHANGHTVKLVKPLPMASLHIMSAIDTVVPITDSHKLARVFDLSGRQLLLHRLEHVVPQKTQHISAIAEFLQWFLDRVATEQAPSPLATNDAQAVAAAAAAAGSSTQQLTDSDTSLPAHVAKAAASLQPQEGALPRTQQQLPGTSNDASLQQGSTYMVDDIQHGTHKPFTSSSTASAAAAVAAAAAAPGQAPGTSTLQGVEASSVEATTRSTASPSAAKATTASSTAGISAAVPHDSNTGASAIPEASPALSSAEAVAVAVAPSSSGLQPAATSAAPAPLATEPAVDELDASAHAASEEHMEEMEALEAIFADEYSLISTRPPKFIVHLKEPGQEEDASQELLPSGPPSRLFSITFTLPLAYPQASPPVMHITGPLAPSDPRHQQLQAHLEAIATEAVGSTAAGCVFQAVEEAKSWINANLPDNIGDKRAGPAPSVRPAGNAPNAAGNAADGLASTAASDTAPSCPWYEKEEADVELVRRAIAEASLAQWRHYDVDEGQRAAEERQPDAAGAGAGLLGEAAAAAGEGSEWVQRGRWDYVVGLVGKPSAGKSTFYNAVVDPTTDDEGARVGSFPFTTITPNVGRGYFMAPDPAPVLGLAPSACQPIHGHVAAFDLERVSAKYTNVAQLRQWAQRSQWGPNMLWRRAPVLVKDVAGLVPGAYKGRGRGNAFLNDLTDADVLIHVVDASGSTNKEGQLVDEGEGGDPLDDIGWVREELHRWVFDNVRSKWATVLRKPARLPDMFTGYHASRALVFDVIQRVGVNPDSLVVEGASLAHWGEYEVHKLVATFLQARFPILVALNKADMEASHEHIQRIRSVLPHEPVVAVSAASERWLCSQRRAAAIEYHDAAPDVIVLPSCQDTAVAGQLAQVNRRVLQRYGGTGALLALTAAVAMRAPRIVFPVGDLEGCTALVARSASSGAVGLLGAGQDAKVRAAEGNSPGVLRDTVLLRPGSTTEDLYWVLKRPPYQLVEGEFVRAECRVLHAQPQQANGSAAAAAGAAVGAAGGGKGSRAHSRMVKKDEVLDFSNCIIKVMTNRRK